MKYLFKGQKHQAKSKDELLRKLGYPVNTKNYRLVVKIKPYKGDKS